jgi:predicted N-acetyltransferase YhbS
MNIQIRQMNINDPTIISTAFKMQGWNKPIELFMDYFEEQKMNKRITLVAEINSIFTGYINILWNSYYQAFVKDNIPEIADFNVLIKYRNIGIGNKLMDKAEEIIKNRVNYVGIGVGLYSDYGSAQKMYVKRGYIPDGKGICKNNSYVKPGETVIIDDNVILYFIKKL